MWRNNLDHSSLPSPADPVVVYKYCEVLIILSQKCETVGLYKQLIWFMFHNLQWEERSANSTRDVFLYVSVYTGTEPSSDHYSCLTQSPSLPQESKGARGGENPVYTCQACLPCPGWLNVILHPCLCHQLT